MSQPQQMNMGGMGGPVGGAPPQQQQQQQQQQQNAGTPSNGSGVNANDSAETVKRLNTYIYDYFLRNQHYDIARAMINASSMELLTQPKQSPSQRQNQPNGIDEMDTDRPKDLPEPGLQNTEGPFLQDWWFQFWDIYNSRRNHPSKQTTVGYLAAQRAGQKQRGNMMGGGMDPGAMQNMRQMSMMSNGMMSNDLKKAAMQNAGATNMTPQQQMAQVQRMRAAQGQQQMMQGQQMERSNSQMDMNGPRPGSPGSGDAPSPKRQRMDGNVQQMGPRPGQQGQMPNTQVGLDTSSLDPAAANQTRELLVRSGIDVNSMPVEQFNLIAMQPTNYQQKSAEQYSQQMQQSAMVAMNQAKSNMNKGMPPNVSAAMGPAGAQGSPLSQAGMDPTLEFGPNGGMRPGMVPGAAGAVAAGAPGGPNSGNHALQDYQMQLMLLEQQNKKRLLMARQEQDSMSSHPGMPPGPNGQFAPNMSPQGSRAGGPSPNPNEMARGTPKMQPGASPNGHMQGRVSPAPGFDPSQGIPPNMRNQMVMGPNGQMMPRSHPQYAGVQAQLTQGQLEMFNRANMMPNGTFPGGGQPMPPNMMPGGPPMQGQQQPGQGPPNMTPRQGNQAMPPPPAPQPNATGATQPSSPAPAPAPPTPNQSNKPKPGAKKDNKSAKKAAATKKGGQTGATPASESEQPPTPTPATPITPMNPNSFQNKQQIAPNGMQNGAQQQQPQHQQQQNQNSNGVQQPPSDMGGPFGGSGNLVDEGFGLNMDFADVSAGGGDVLDNFDFDSFLNTDDAGMGFDFPSFDGGLEAGGDGMGGQ